MKKIIWLIGIIFIIICSLFIYIILNDKKYNDKMEENILNNTELSSLEYVNKYDKYYTVLAGDYLYIFDNKYNEIFKVDRILIYDNSEKYDIIYKDEKIMYFSDSYIDGKLVYNYYDIYTYKLINSIEVG